MSVDPFTLSTAIIALSEALSRVILLFNGLINAEEMAEVLRKDCAVTKEVLDHIQQQLAASEVPREVRIDGSRASDATGSINLCNVLRDIVEQLQLDIDVLEAQLLPLRGPGHPETRIGRLLGRGQVAWRLQYLSRTHQRILTQREHLQLVLISLNLWEFPSPVSSFCLCPCSDSPACPAIQTAAPRNLNGGGRPTAH